MLRKCFCIFCKEQYTATVCPICSKVIQWACGTCHAEIEHDKIPDPSENIPLVGDLKSSPYSEEDAQYYPGICDKWQSYNTYFRQK